MYNYFNAYSLHDDNYMNNVQQNITARQQPSRATHFNREPNVQMNTLTTPNSAYCVTEQRCTANADNGFCG